VPDWKARHLHGWPLLVAISIWLRCHILTIRLRRVNLPNAPPQLVGCDLQHDLAPLARHHHASERAPGIREREDGIDRGLELASICKLTEFG
jgi:hypothetical protein